ncbi:MAG: hypothetical protein H0X51_03465 [Parachlamydiaceae bacterium]|nr:hypothetical protein [Parachlamydiaceae bacterium]
MTTTPARRCCDPLTMYDPVLNRPRSKCAIHQWIGHCLKTLVNLIIAIRMRCLSPEYIAKNFHRLSLENIYWLKESQLALINKDGTVCPDSDFDRTALLKLYRAGATDPKRINKLFRCLSLNDKRHLLNTLKRMHAKAAEERAVKQELQSPFRSNQERAFNLSLRILPSLQPLVENIADSTLQLASPSWIKSAIDIASGRDICEQGPTRACAENRAILAYIALEADPTQLTKLVEASPSVQIAIFENLPQDMRINLLTLLGSQHYSGAQQRKQESVARLLQIISDFETNRKEQNSEAHAALFNAVRSCINSPTQNLPELELSYLSESRFDLFEMLKLLPAIHTIQEGQHFKDPNVPKIPYVIAIFEIFGSMAKLQTKREGLELAAAQISFGLKGKLLGATELLRRCEFPIPQTILDANAQAKAGKEFLKKLLSEIVARESNG